MIADSYPPGQGSAGKLVLPADRGMSVKADFRHFGAIRNVTSNAWSGDQIVAT
jgi:hypothetical protein